MNVPDPSKQDDMLQRLRRRWPVWMLAAVTFLFFWQYFLLDQTPFGGDTAFVFIPFRHYVIHRLLHGELPLWDPYLFGGTPGLAEPQYQTWYLPNLVLFVLGVPRGMGWLLPLHLFWMGLGTYLFARRSLSLDRPAASVAALAFAFSGCMQSRLINSPYPEAAAWLPWILLAYDIACARRGAFLVLPGMAVAIQLCTGAPQYTYYTLIVLLAYSLYRARFQHRSADGAGAGASPSVWRWIVLAVTVVLGAALVTVQLLPEFELGRLSDRGIHASYAYVAGASMPAHHFFPAMLFPKFWGSFSATPLDGFPPTVELGYLGAITLGLMAVALAVAQPRHAVCFWFGVAAITLVLAFGDNTPLYPILYRYVPGTATFRTPAHWLVITSFAGALLAGLGMQAVLEGGRQGIAAARIGLGVMAALSGVAVAVLLSPWGAPAFGTPQTPYGPWGQVVLIALCTVVFLPRCFGTPQAAEPQRGVLQQLAGRPLWSSLVLVLLIFDLFAVSQDMEMQHTLPVANLETQPDTVSHLRGEPVAGRFWSGGNDLPLEPWQIGGPASTLEPADFRARNAAVLRALMPSCLAAEFRTYGLTGAWGTLMPMRRHARPIYQTDTPWPVQLRWLRLLNVGHYLSLHPLAEPTFTAESSDLPLIYRDPLAMPRAFAVGDARWVKGAEAMEFISSAQFDPHREALLELPPGEVADPFTDSEPRSAMTPARFAVYRPERVALDVTMPSAGVLVLMDTPFPGWQARVDGQPAQLYVANWVGRGVALPAGPHHVDMWFEPVTVRLGMFVTLASLSICAAIAAAGFNRRLG